MSISIQLNGKTALVTGGSRGIGRATCLLLAQAGADVAFSYLQEEAAARQLETEIEAQGGGSLSLEVDVRDPDAVSTMFETVHARFGRIDLVIGNAGIWNSAGIDEMTIAQWKDTIATNLDSMFLTCHHAARYLKPQRSGKLVLLTSTAGQRGEAFHAHYAASKGGIIALTKSLAGELGPYNINVNAVAPGWVETDMTADVLNGPEFRMTVQQSIPMKRIATPEDIAKVILFLCSDLSGYLQGEIINVNGGSVLCG